MVDKNLLVRVTNRDNGIVGYTLPELNVKRTFQPAEVKEISVDELRQLSYQAGGKYIIENCLVIDNQDVVNELLGEVEPEYFYSKDDVKNILLNGTLAQFQDCLDFAPAGVIDLIKTTAVELEINDINKREAILKKTGFNVTNAIDLKKQAAATTEEPADEQPKARRAAPMTNDRRTEPPKYNVVKTNK